MKKLLVMMLLLSGCSTNLGVLRKDQAEKLVKCALLQDIRNCGKYYLQCENMPEGKLVYLFGLPQEFGGD